MSRIYDPLEWDDIRTMCEVTECKDCPRMGDDCDGKIDDEDDDTDGAEAEAEAAARQG